ncbi:MAG: HD domain-containing protein [Erysipelotrichaceae bacterium]|nr:HD domain-containing protein [Erysipelotrichaceae bacterium]
MTRNTKLKTFILVSILLLNAVSFKPLKAEKENIDLSRTGIGYASVLYDNTNGLPTSEANAIAETEEGFIWIGGYSGLVRYDGSEFVRFDSTTGIASVISLFVDSKDRLWIGTNDSGVFVMKNADLTRFTREDGLRDLSIREIGENSTGEIFIATTRGIYYIDSSMVMHQLDEPLINDAYIKEFKISSDDVIYGITNDGNLFVIRNKKLTSYYDVDALGIDDVHCILPDNENPGYVYIGTKASKMYYGRLDDVFNVEYEVDLSPLNYINSINQINENLWICADNGIGIYDGHSFSAIDNVPLTNSIEKMMTDYQGNLWFTSSKQGVMKIVKSRFTDLNEQYDLEPTVVNATALYNGLLFIGSKDDGITIVDEKSGKLDSYPLYSCRSAAGEDLGQSDLMEALKGKRIRSMIEDSKGNLWISTYGQYALIRLNDHDMTSFTPDDGLPSDRIRVVYERKDGTIMVAATGGIALIDKNKVTRVYGKNDGINNTEILTALETEDGKIMMGSDGDGIYLLDDKGVRSFGIDEGLESEVVMRIKKDSIEDVYWIVTSNSLAYMDSDYTIHTISHFPYSNNFDIYENKKGDLWILSSNGIYVVSRSELLRNEEINPLYYNRSNGLSILSNANSYSSLNENGDLYIAGTTGVSKVNIDDSFESVSDLKMVVPYIEADSKLIYPDDSGHFTIDASTQRLTIYPFIYNYSLINPQVTYHLQGFEDQTTTLERSALKPIDYTNLRGGDYTFIMKIKDPAGSDEQEIAVSISKVKNFYEEIWFYILLMLFAAGVMVHIVRTVISKKTAEYERKSKENRALIREITQALAKTIDMKDKYTNGHSTRVADYTAMLTRELGYNEDTVEKYYNIALLHDLGKIGVKEEVLNKPGKLDDDEFNIIKSHSTLGYNVLKDISIMPELADGAGFHHERPDGRGYPRGLKGHEIPRVAQIIAVADTFDAMYSNRPYRKRMNFDKVVSIIKEVRGTQLTSDVVDAFLRLVEKGEFKDPNDDGGGSMEDINNIHKKYEEDKEERS